MSHRSAGGIISYISIEKKNDFEIRDKIDSHSPLASDDSRIAVVSFEILTNK